MPPQTLPASSFSPKAALLLWSLLRGRQGGAERSPPSEEPQAGQPVLPFRSPQLLCPPGIDSHGPVNAARKAFLQQQLRDVSVLGGRRRPSATHGNHSLSPIPKAAPAASPLKAESPSLAAPHRIGPVQSEGGERGKEVGTRGGPAPAASGPRRSLELSGLLGGSPWRRGCPSEQPPLPFLSQGPERTLDAI